MQVQCLPEPVTASEVLARARDVRDRLYGVGPRRVNVARRLVEKKAEAEAERKRRIAEARAKTEGERKAIEMRRSAEAQEKADREIERRRAFMCGARVPASEISDGLDALCSAADPMSAYGEIVALPPEPQRISPMEILRAAEVFFDKPIAALQGVSRSREFTIPRQIAIWAVRSFCHHVTMPQIGRRFGGRDHTTILYSFRKIDAEVAAKSKIGQLAKEFAAVIASEIGA